MLSISVGLAILLAIVGAGMLMELECKKPRRRCRGGCDPKWLIATWDDGRSRKVRCQKCDWLHHAEPKEYTRN